MRAWTNFSVIFYATTRMFSGVISERRPVMVCAIFKFPLILSEELSLVFDNIVLLLIAFIIGDMSVLDLMVWRFLALGDPTVKIMLSRDLDSILTNRESRAVLDWQVNTTKMLISLRDHPSHEVPLLGGMWGANNHLVGHTLGTQLQAAIIWNGVDRQNDFASGYDQFVLTQAIWRPYKEHFVSYDSYSCYIYMWDDNFLLVRPFPTQRENNQNDFVGNPELGGGNYNLQPCPVECRPSYGKNWTYC